MATIWERTVSSWIRTFTMIRYLAESSALVSMLLAAGLVELVALVLVCARDRAGVASNERTRIIAAIFFFIFE